MSDLPSNLIAEAIGLIVGLFVTYLIVEKLLRRQQERTWRPARDRLVRRLRSSTNLAIAAWVHVADPAAVPIGYELRALSGEEEDRIMSAAAEELSALKVSGQVFGLRNPVYWRKVVYALARLRSPLTQAVERLQITLREDPALVQALTDLEDDYQPVAAFAGQLDILSSFDDSDSMPRIADQVADQLLEMLAPRIVKTLESLLGVQAKLSAIPK